MTIGTVWIDGPRVDLTSVIAGSLSFTVNFLGANPSGLATSDTGHYRIQQIVGASETTVFTGRVIVTPAIIGVQGWLLVISDLSTADWSGVNFPESSTGAVSYRLDFKLDTITYELATATLFARRT